MQVTLTINKPKTMQILEQYKTLVLYHTLTVWCANSTLDDNAPVDATINKTQTK